ncbi:MAG: hypothetical protein V2B18_02520 [Pseudomonadota bacterium]
MNDNPGPPSVEDFSKGAIQRAVLYEALTHPATLYPGVLAILGGVAWPLFHSPWSLLAALGASAVSLGCLVANYFFRNEALAKKYVEHLARRTVDDEAQRLRDLYDDLSEAANISGAEEYAKQGAEQFIRIRDSYRRLDLVVTERLSSGNEDVGRIWGASEQVYLGVLENLKDIVNRLKTTAGIDPKYINERRKALRTLRNPTDADRAEMETLKQRWLLREEQLERINEILTRNEEALTRMEEAVVTVGTLRTETASADVDPEMSVKRLGELVKQVRSDQKNFEA